MGHSTLEDIADHVVNALRRSGALSPGPRVSWDAFLRLSSLVHDRFVVPSTTFTPMMRRMLYALGAAARATRIVGVGTYVGYTFSWLLRDRRDAAQAPFLDAAVGIDLDAASTRLARRNCALLGHGKRVRFVAGEGVAMLTKWADPIDLLYLDLDDRNTGKSAYRTALAAALPRLAQGALVLAHDACVPRFAEDFALYDRSISETGGFRGPWRFPVDACGLSVAVRV